MTIYLYQGDIPDGLDFGSSVAIDTETLGLNPLRDRLCLMQLSSGNGDAHLVQFKEGEYDAPNLKKMLSDPNVEKLYHFARFDVAIIWAYLDVLTAPIYCTKIASRLARTFTSHHGLRNLCHDLIGVDLNKQQQSSYWGVDELSDAQKEYAASDVLYLHRLREKLDEMLEREGRKVMADACYDFLPYRAVMDIAGYADEDIFAHH